MNQGVTRHFGALVGKNEVVDDAAAFVGLARNRDVDIGIRLQPVSALLKHLPVLRREVVTVELKTNVL